MAIFVAGEKRVKLRGGWTEMQREQSGRVGEEIQRRWNGVCGGG